MATEDIQLIEVEVAAIPAIIEVVTQSGPAVVEVLVPGIAGPVWDYSKAFLLRQMSLPILDGRLEIDFAAANTAFVLLTEDVDEIAFVGVPQPGVSGRVQLYVQQDEVGGRLLRGWPSNVWVASETLMDNSLAPNARDSYVLDTFDGGTTVHLNLVGLSYRPME